MSGSNFLVKPYHRVEAAAEVFHRFADFFYGRLLPRVVDKQIILKDSRALHMEFHEDLVSFRLSEHAFCTSLL